MSDEREETSLRAKANDEAQPEDEDDDDVGSPFDHPAFLPVLLWALSLWFGYDGWFNDDPDMQEHLSFNRYGFAVLIVFATYFTIQGVREMRADSEGPPDS